MKCSPVACGLVCIPLSLAGRALAQATTRVSVDSRGIPGEASSTTAAISADGRFVAFASSASNLVAGDTNGTFDVFVHDRSSGATERVSVSSAGVEGDNGSSSPSISNDGRYVTFQSSATNLVAGDTNATVDIFVRDRTLGTTVRASVSFFGAQGNGPCGAPQISGNGQFVTYSSDANNLVFFDTNGRTDVFVRDLVAATTFRVSVSGTNTQASGKSVESSISDDGRYIVFASDAADLVAGDTNGKTDVFLRDQGLAVTTRVSGSGSIAEGNDDSGQARISGDAHFIAFASRATNLVAGDTNGVTDVFRVDRITSAIVRASVTSLGAQANNDSYAPALSIDGRFVVYTSQASNLAPGDVNAQMDVFRTDVTLSQTALVSLDSSGNQGNQPSSSGNAVSGDGRFVAFTSSASNLVGGDSNAATDAFVRDTLATAWPPVLVYCVAKLNSAGCVPTISSAGLPSISGATNLFVTATRVLNKKSGIFFWGVAPATIPFLGGTLCVAWPNARTPLQNSGGSATGSDCTGAYSFHFSAAYIQARGLAVGDDVYGQYWSRDPASSGTAGLTDAIHFGIVP